MDRKKIVTAGSLSLPLSVYIFLLAYSVYDERDLCFAEAIS